jgi:Protein of unknown function (DUF2949)
MSVNRIAKTVHFLREDLLLPQSSIDLALKKAPSDYDVLPIVMWQYGLVTLSQLDAIFDYFETQSD